MSHEIRESRLLCEHHALSGYVPMLAPTHTYLYACIYKPLFYVPTYISIHEQYNQTCIYTDIYSSHTAILEKT